MIATGKNLKILSVIKNDRSLSILSVIKTDKSLSLIKVNRSLLVSIIEVYQYCQW